MRLPRRMSWHTGPNRVANAIVQPLAGVRVLDFSSMMAGPYCGRWLADLGADVIKVEPPEGDYMRSVAPLRDGHSAYFGYLNCGKRSIVLDLKRAQGQDLARQLAAASDVLLEASRPGVMARLHLDAASLAISCSRLVYCSISGYGQEGPRAENPAYAAVVHATSGFDMAWQAAQAESARESGPPTCGIQVADVVAASFAALAIQSALLARASTGRGQHVDLSMAECMLALMPLELMQAQFPSDAHRAMYRPVRAADGFVVIMPLGQRNFLDLCKALDRTDLQVDERFATPASRSRHWDELLTEVGHWAAAMSARQCVAVLSEHGVPAANYRTVGEALADQQLSQRGFLGRAEDGAGEFAIANLPFRLNGAPVRGGASRVPALGEHTAQVLRELLGLKGVALRAAIEAAGASDALARAS